MKQVTDNQHRITKATKLTFMSNGSGNGEKRRKGEIEKKKGGEFRPLENAWKQSRQCRRK